MAHRCWWTCLSIPVEVLNDIAVQAWKKLTLVQPLLDINTKQDKTNVDGIRNITSVDIATFTVTKKKNLSRPGTRLPRCMPKALSKGIRTLIDASSIGALKQEKNQAGEDESQEMDFYSVYAHLGPAVEAVDRSHAESLVRMHESVIAADGNTIMAQNCLTRVKELQVRKASMMFSVTSVPILARRWKVTSEEASQQLLDTMVLGIVPCRVEEDGTVVFLPSKDNASNHTKIDLSDLTGWMTLLEQIQRMDLDLSISSKYNSAKRKDDKSLLGDMVGVTGPRGVEDFYGDAGM